MPELEAHVLIESIIVYILTYTPLAANESTYPDSYPVLFGFLWKNE